MKVLPLPLVFSGEVEGTCHVGLLDRVPSYPLPVASDAIFPVLSSSL